MQRGGRAVWPVGGGGAKYKEGEGGEVDETERRREGEERRKDVRVPQHHSWRQRQT